MNSIHPFRSAYLDGCVILLTLALVATTARADDPAATEPPPTGAPAVYVNDSVQANDLIFKANHHAGQKRWETASRLLWRAIENHGDQLFESKPGYFITVTRFAHDFVRSWPTAGKDAFSNLTDSSAQRERDRLKTSTDLTTVLRAFERYRLTPAEYELGLRAVELAIERGEFIVARATCDAMLEDLPTQNRRRTNIAAYLTVAVAMQNAISGLTLPSQVPDDGTIHWMGRDQNLRDVIVEIGEAFVVAPKTSTPEHWPTFAGDYTRNASAIFKPAALSALWRFNDFGQGSPTTLVANDRSYGYRRKPDQRRLLAANPLWVNGVIYAHDAIRVWAIQAETGRLLWSYAQPQSADGVESTFDNSVASWFCPTFDQNRIYACMGGNLVPYYGYEQSGPLAAVVCLNASNGKLLWRHQPTVPRDSNVEVEFDAAPIVTSNMVMVLERRRRSFGFEDCFLLGLDAISGDVKYKTHLAAASIGGFGYRRATTAIAAARDDTLFVCTNLGAFAAVNIQTGAPRWLAAYARRTVTDDSRDELHPFAFNPMLLDDRRLIFKPSDADSVLLARSNDGAITQRLDSSALENIRTLCGVRNDRLYAVGDRAIAFDLNQNRVVWSAQLPEPLFGRPLLTDQAMLTPATQAIYAFDLQSGGRAEYPLQEPDTGGNLLAGGGQIIIASADSICAYADTTRVIEQLRHRIASEPASVEPALNVAEILFQTGQYAPAVSAISEALRRVEDRTKHQPALAQRIFDDCLAFEQQLAQKETPHDNIRALRHTLLELASRCPPDPSGQLTWRLRWAKLYEQDGSADRAVNLYQQILSDPALRSQRIEQDGSMDTPIATWCTQKINQLIETHGRQAYAKQETEAASRLSDARQSDDIAVIEQIADTYPNSRAACEALLLAGDRHKENGDHIQAIRRYYNAYYTCENATICNEKPCVTDRIADCFAQMGDHDAQTRWLKITQRNCSQSAPIDDPTQTDHRPTRYATWSAIPSVAFEHRFSGRCALLAPRTQSPFAHDAFFVYTDAAITAFDPATGRPIWDKPSPCRMQPRIVAHSKARTVFATRHQIFALDRKTGMRLWSKGRYPSDLTDPLFDHENFSTFRYHTISGGVLHSFQDNGQRIRIDITSGKTLAAGALQYPPITKPLATGDCLAFAIHHNDRDRLCVADAAAGKTRTVIDAVGDASITRLAATDDQQIIVATVTGLHAVDANSGEVRWRFAPQQPLVPASLKIATDGIYVATQNKIVRKLRLTDGQPLWRSKPLALHEDGAVRLVPLADALLVLGEGFAAKLDDTTGAIQFVPKNADRISPGLCLTTEQYLISLELGDAQYDEPANALIVNLATGDPVNHHAIKSPNPITSFAGAVALDNALVILDGSRIIGWTAPQ